MTGTTTTSLTPAHMDEELQNLLDASGPGHRTLLERLDVSDPPLENKPDHPAESLLVMQHLGDKLLVRRTGRQRRWQTDGIEQAPEAINVPMRDEPQLGPPLGLQHQTDGHGPTMADGLVLCGFQCPSEGVSEVQRHAKVGLVDVGTDESALDLGVALGDLAHELVVAHELLGSPALAHENFLKQREEALVGHTSVLDRLCQPSADLLRRQGSPRGEVDEDGPWLVEGPDEVRGCGCVDP